jgi:hypothetical protein
VFRGVLRAGGHLSVEISCKKVLVLAALFSVASATIAFAKQNTKLSPARGARTIPPSIGDNSFGFVLRQDLFDRNDPNNRRSDYPGPPAQPGPGR